MPIVLSPLMTTQYRVKVRVLRRMETAFVSRTYPDASRSGSPGRKPQLSNNTKVRTHPRRVCIKLLTVIFLNPSLCLGVRRAILVRMGKLDETCPGSCP
jgi:hypothetical protein